MAVNELSWRQLYMAKIDTSVPYVPSPHWVHITQMHEPWRRGRAVVLPALWPGKTFVVGRWVKSVYDGREDLSEERWLNPHWMASVSADEISTWDDLSAPAEESSL